MKKHKKLQTLTGKVVLAWMLVLAISNAIIGTISYIMYRNQLLQAKAEEALSVAVAIAVRIDGDKFSEIMDTLEKNDYWYEIKEYADNVSIVFDTAFIYILNNDYTDKVTYFAEGAPGEAPFDLGMTEMIDGIYADEMFTTLRTGISSYTKPYSSGEYGNMVSGFAAIKDRSGHITGVVGVDFHYIDTQQLLTTFAIWLVGIIVAFLVGCYFLMTYLGTKLAGKPLSDLDEAAQKLSAGNMDVKLNIQSKTEIGRLANSFVRMIETMNEQVSALEVLSHGDLTPHIKPRSDKDTMGFAIAQILSNLNDMFKEINQSAAMVSSGARQISDNSQSLAQGASEQSDAIKSLHLSISDMTTKANDNLRIAAKANDLTTAIKSDAHVGSEYMEKLTHAVKDISDASLSISEVIKAIDDIAFQTNILALNASVEAARAGQHGKGFAVVAGEVRNLAAKSAEAAKNTEMLISNSIEKSRLGASIASETADSLDRIIQGIDECATSVSTIAKSFETQLESMAQINKSIEQVSSVVQQNSETTRESAIASIQMNNQSEVLEELVSNFKLRDSVPHDTISAFPVKPKNLPQSSSSISKSDNNPYRRY